MRISRAEVLTWSAERLLEEYEARVDYVTSLLGDAEDVLAAEAELIGGVCLTRHACHPNYLVGNGHVIRSWTDSAGVVHSWRWRLACTTSTRGPRSRDMPTRAITCIECIWRFP